MDVIAGKTLGCGTILVTAGPDGGSDVVEPPDYIADRFLEAMLWLVKK